MVDTDCGLFSSRGNPAPSDTGSTFIWANSFLRFSGLFRQRRTSPAGFYREKCRTYDIRTWGTFYPHENDGCFVGDRRVISGRVLKARSEITAMHLTPREVDKLMIFTA